MDLTIKSCEIPLQTFLFLCISECEFLFHLGIHEFQVSSLIAACCREAAELYSVLSPLPADLAPFCQLPATCCWVRQPVLSLSWTSYWITSLLMTPASLLWSQTSSPASKLTSTSSTSSSSSPPQLHRSGRTTVHSTHWERELLPWGLLSLMLDSMTCC